jgi:hypothetical protein
MPSLVQGPVKPAKKCQSQAQTGLSMPLQTPETLVSRLLVSVDLPYRVGDEMLLCGQDAKIAPLDEARLFHLIGYLLSEAMYEIFRCIHRLRVFRKNPCLKD